MNEYSNVPISPEPAGVAGWFSIWMRAVTKPSEQTYGEFAASAAGKLSIAFLWVFLGSLVSSFVASLVQGPMIRQNLQLFRQMGWDVPDIPVGGIGNSFVSAICGAPVGAVMAVVGFAISTALIQWVAKMFGGKGTFEQLAYVLAAILVPGSLVNAVFSLVSAIPFVGLCISILNLAIGIYLIALGVMAVKAVNQFDWGQALASYFLPVIFFACLCACALGGVAYAMKWLLNQPFAP